MSTVVGSPCEAVVVVEGLVVVLERFLWRRMRYEMTLI